MSTIDALTGLRDRAEHNRKSFDFGIKEAKLALDSLLGRQQQFADKVAEYDAQIAELEGAETDAAVEAAVTPETANNHLITSSDTGIQAPDVSEKAQEAAGDDNSAGTGESATEGSEAATEASEAAEEPPAVEATPVVTKTASKSTAKRVAATK